MHKERRKILTQMLATLGEVLCGAADELQGLEEEVAVIIGRCARCKRHRIGMPDGTFCRDCDPTMREVDEILASVDEHREHALSRVTEIVEGSDPLMRPDRGEEDGN
jgi:hypothetical protein